MNEKLLEARRVCQSQSIEDAMSNARAEARHGFWAGVRDESGARTCYTVYAWPMDTHPDGRQIVAMKLVAWEVPE